MVIKKSRIGEQPERDLYDHGQKDNRKERAEIVAFCIEHGKNYPLTIKTYGVSYQQIYAWVRKYEEKGVAGLVDGRGRTSRRVK